VPGFAISDPSPFRLKQREIADLLGIHQPEVSHLMNGHFSHFTTDRLLDFLKRVYEAFFATTLPHFVSIRTSICLLCDK